MASAAARPEVQLPAQFECRIGNTPLLQLGDTNIYAKLEGHNPSGSIKDRALSRIMQGMLEDRRLGAQDDTLCLVTSGSAGVSLAQMHKALTVSPEYTFDMLIVMPTAYAAKPIPSEIIAMDDVTVFHSAAELLADSAGGSTSSRQRVLLLDDIFIEVLAETKRLAVERGWKMLDQHHDRNGLVGHESTANEIMQALPGVTDVICSTGTGATAAGLRAYLPAHVRVHARPGASGEIDGLSDVGRYNNFCDASALVGYYDCVFDSDHAVEHQEHLLSQYGIAAGPSSGATHWLAGEICEDSSEQQIAFIAADGCLLPSAQLDLGPMTQGRPARIVA